MLFVIVLI